jgi:hypothetical protein
MGSGGLDVDGNGRASTGDVASSSELVESVCARAGAEGLWGAAEGVGGVVCREAGAYVVGREASSGDGEWACAAVWVKRSEETGGDGRRRG